MRFEDQVLEACYKRVSRYMGELYGDAAADPERPAFELRRGSAIVTTSVQTLGDTALVRVESWVVTDVEPTHELLEFLLRSNDQFLHGGFGLDGDGDVFFRVTLYGDTLDRPELEWAVEAVAGAADDFDDEIAQRFGGLRAVDRA
jgi:adenylate cyclase